MHWYISKSLLNTIGRAVKQLAECLDKQSKSAVEVKVQHAIPVGCWTSTLEQCYQHLLVSFPDHRENDTDQWHMPHVFSSPDPPEKWKYGPVFWVTHVVGLVSQARLSHGEERVWSNSHHHVGSNMPSQNFLDVNWLSGEWGAVTFFGITVASFPLLTPGIKASILVGERGVLTKFLLFQNASQSCSHLLR